ncbi:MAG: DinB family protein [Ginsengibacter sp.]
MIPIATEIETSINNYLPQFDFISKDEYSLKPSPTKWSKKELVGHLIDSAQSNLRRFVVAQYEESPTINYNQDKWVAINNYQAWDVKDLVQLFYLLNRQIVFVLKNISVEMSRRICISSASYTIEWLAQDYLKHLKHHLHQVLNLEPFAYS